MRCSVWGRAVVSGRIVIAIMVAALIRFSPAWADTSAISALSLIDNAEISGFFEMRGGTRIQSNDDEEHASILDSRLQLELFTYADQVDIKFKGDVVGDDIIDDIVFDPREAWMFTRALGGTDLTIGRQVLTWGTGDLVFLNDLFPKDWQSFFIGRDAEYLKAPSDAVKLSLFSELADLDVVYTPQFDPDRYVTGEYLSYWNQALQRCTGRDDIVDADRPDRWFRDHEIAWRIYKNIENWELALYGYTGFWKTPSGSDGSGKAIFPRLNVYGASIRGQVGQGIGNLEFAWYDSKEDRAGDNPLVGNSQLRLLTGYARDLGGDLNVGLQYYVEQILDYDAYKAGLYEILGELERAKDRFRHLLTVQITKLLLNQTLTLSLSGYISPSDRDAYLKPCVTYQYTDTLLFEAGANIFAGRDSHTFFAQFENNTNIYLAVCYYY